MTGITMDRHESRPAGLTNWARKLFVVLAVVVLLALSFAIGRATMGHASHTTAVIPAAVQPAAPPAGNVQQPICHGPHHPC